MACNGDTFTLEGLVVGIWVPCDHILLIYLCSKTLRLHASVTEMCRKTWTVWTTKARKWVEETIEILSVNTLLFTYRRCSILPPPTSIHFLYRQIIMPNSWKDSRLITDDSNCYFYSFHKILWRFHLNDTFGNRWIGRGDLIAWHPRSPDLTPLDFHFWGIWKLWYTRVPWRHVLWHEHK